MRASIKSMIAYIVVTFSIFACNVNEALPATPTIMLKAQDSVQYPENTIVTARLLHLKNRYAKRLK